MSTSPGELRRTDFFDRLSISSSLEDSISSDDEQKTEDRETSIKREGVEEKDEFKIFFNRAVKYATQRDPRFYNICSDVDDKFRCLSTNHIKNVTNNTPEAIEAKLREFIQADRILQSINFESWRVEVQDVQFVENKRYCNIRLDLSDFRYQQTEEASNKSFGIIIESFLAVILPKFTSYNIKEIRITEINFTNTNVSVHIR